MASLLTGLWQLVISVVVLSQLSATLPPLERTRRHADGVFNSELSKMNENAYVQKLVKSLVGLNQRYQRHSDGMFTSELSKMRGNAQVQKLIKSLVGYKRRIIKHWNRLPRETMEPLSLEAFKSSVPRSSGLEGQMEKPGFTDHAENGLGSKEQLTKLRAFLGQVQNLRGSDEADGSPGLIHTDIPSRHENGSYYDDFCFMWLYQNFLNDSLSESDAREATQMAGQYICPPSNQWLAQMKEELSDLDEK